MFVSTQVLPYPALWTRDQVWRQQRSSLLLEMADGKCGKRPCPELRRDGGLPGFLALGALLAGKAKHRWRGAARVIMFCGLSADGQNDGGHTKGTRLCHP